MWQLTSEGEGSSSPPSPHCPRVQRAHFQPVCRGLLAHPGLSPGKVTFTFAGFASPPCYGVIGQSGKEPNVSVCWSLRYHAKGTALGLGVRVLMTGLSTPTIRVGSQVASRLSDGVRTDLARAGAVPVQPAVDGENLDNMNNGPHIIFLRRCRCTGRSLPNLTPSPRLPGVSLCLRRERTSFSPSFRKRWSKVSQRQ